jgi:hypothetical protein
LVVERAEPQLQLLALVGRLVDQVVAVVDELQLLVGLGLRVKVILEELDQGHLLNMGLVVAAALVKLAFLVLALRAEMAVMDNTVLIVALLLIMLVVVEAQPMFPQE